MASQKKSRKRAPLDEAALYEYAVRALSNKMRTVRDLKRLMRARAGEGDPGERAMDTVVAKLKQMNYLNDTRFAADYTRLRQENQKFGRRRVQQDLMQKGVHKDLIASTLTTAYEDVDELALARQYVQRKRMKKPVDQKESTRIMGRLMRAGFSAGAIYKVLKSWDVAVEEADLEGVEEA